MIQGLIDKINKTDEFEDELFLTVLEETDALKRQQYLELIRKKCSTVSRLREFNNLFKAWVTKMVQLEKQGNGNKTNFTDQPLQLNCARWVCNDSGVILADYNSQGLPITIQACPHPIMPVERYRNIETDTEKVKLAFRKDLDWREITVDNGTVLNKSAIIMLADRGVMVTSETSRDMVRYIADTLNYNVREIPLYKSIGRLGWINGEFMPYNNEVRYDGDKNYKSLYDSVRQEGSFSSWFDCVEPLRANKTIRLVMAASFASPLLEILGALPFVLHLWGVTGFGKTVTLMVAGSIWGDPDMGKLVKTMNMTTNAMTRTACFLYNIPFLADELQQVKQYDGTYDRTIMQVTEGIDRGRAEARGNGVEATKTWKNAFIFTGEEPVTKDCSGGGVKNRVIEVECEEKLIEDGNFVANTVKENFGYGGKIFIAYVMDLLENNKEFIPGAYKKLFKDILEAVDTTDKQAYSMAAILLADKLACDCLFHDEPLTAEDVKDYLVSKSAVRVDMRAYEEVVSLISRNVSKFDKLSLDAWGKIESDTALINKQVLTQEMSALGFDLNAVKKAWAKDGKLIKNSEGRYLHCTRVNGIRGSFIKLQLPHEEFEEVDSEDVPF